MKSKLISAGEPKTFAVVFDAGDEAMEGLTRFAKENELSAGRITAVGAFQEATLGYFDIGAKEYQKIPVTEQVEVLSLVGDITLSGKDTKVHAHVVLGRRDGSTVGGHLLKAKVRPTLEVI